MLTSKRFIYFLSIGLGIGLIPFFPGTIASILTILIWYFGARLPSLLSSVLLLVSILVGVYICTENIYQTKMHDSKSIVWDEFTGMWLTLLIIQPVHLKDIILSFLLFRLLDIIKPWPIIWFDMNIKGGIGVMVDDLIASLFTVAVLNISVRLHFI